jgi:HK97 family phage portal protein
MNRSEHWSSTRLGGVGLRFWRSTPEPDPEPPPPVWMPQGFDPGLMGLFGAWGPGLAERVGTATRCLQLVSQQIAAMPLRYRGGAPEPRWTSSPDPTWFPNGIGDAVFAAMASLYGWGDAFLLVIDRYQTGYPRGFTVLDPGRVSVEFAPNGFGRTYRVGAVQFDAGDVLQISRNPSPGALRGTSALRGYATNLQAAAAAESFARDFFVGGGVPWAVLQPSKRVNSEDAARLQSQWVARAGVRGGAPAVIPPDITFTQFSFNPKDLLLIESREWDAKQIAAAFGCPAFLLNMDQASGLNYSNPAMLFDTWWRTELYPTARRLEAALTMWLPRGNWVEFDPSILLRPDLKTTSEVWLALLAQNVVTEDEVRAAVLDLPPLSEGDAVKLIDEPPGGGVGDLSNVTPPPVLEVVTG